MHKVRVKNITQAIQSGTSTPLLFTATSVQCPEVKHDISHHIKHRAYVYAWVHVHSPADDHRIDQQHYHMGSELEKWQKREGHQGSIEENIQTPVRTWIGLKNHKEWPEAMNWYRGQQKLNEFWLGPEW